MAIKTTPKKIGDAMPALQILMGVKLLVKAAYAVGKLTNACHSELAEYSAARDKLFVGAGCKIEDGKYVHPEGQLALDAVVKEAEELADVEVEINALPLDITQFGDAQIPGNGFFMLDWAMKPEE